MLIAKMPALQSLPVELLHYILDRLDTKTILFSFRNTCRHFRAVTKSYDRYVLNLESISKPDFEIVCHLVDPRIITSLILSDNDETIDLIKLFHAQFRYRPFTQLRSLIINPCEERQLNMILECIDFRSLKSFSLKIVRSDDRRKTTTARLLSSIIAKSNLSKLQLQMYDGRLEKLVWPPSCSIQYLKIDGVVSFDRICTIIHSLRCLQTLILGSFSISNTQPSTTKSFQQLTSLTFDKITTKIEELEQFLLLTPSLDYLKLIGNNNYLDGNRWEQFIQRNLPLLRKFEFSFNDLKNVQPNPPDIAQIIAPFRTPFWLQLKNWFVTCEVDNNIGGYLSLYTIPFCVSIASYSTNKTSISTMVETNEKMIASVMDNVNTLKLDLKRLLPCNEENKIDKMNCFLFRKVRRLELDLDVLPSTNWIDIISNLIDLNTVIQIKISSTYIRYSNHYMIADVTQLLRRTSRISSVDLCSGFFMRKTSLTATDLCSMLPSQLKYLAVSIKNRDDIQIILERFQHLSTAKFSFDYTPFNNDFNQWLESERKGSSYQTDSFTVNTWLGKYPMPMAEVKIGNKRLKLTDEHH